MSADPKIYLDANLLAQLIDVLQLRQKDDPDRDRAAARVGPAGRPEPTRPRPVVDDDQAQAAVAATAKHLMLIEQTSLGRTPARRVRRRTAPADIAEVLRRSGG